MHDIDALCEIRGRIENIAKTYFDKVINNTTRPREYEGTTIILYSDIPVVKIYFQCTDVSLYPGTFLKGNDEITLDKLYDWYESLPSDTVVESLK